MENIVFSNTPLFFDHPDILNVILGIMDNMSLFSLACSSKGCFKTIRNKNLYTLEKAVSDIGMYGDLFAKWSFPGWEQELLYSSCKHGNISLFKEITTMFSISEYAQLYKCAKYCSRGGHGEVFKEVNSKSLNFTRNPMCLNIAFLFGNKDMLYFLTEHYNYDITDIVEYLTTADLLKNLNQLDSESVLHNISPESLFKKGDSIDELSLKVDIYCNLTNLERKDIILDVFSHPDISSNLEMMRYFYEDATRMGCSIGGLDFCIESPEVYNFLKEKRYDMGEVDYSICNVPEVLLLAQRDGHDIGNKFTTALPKGTTLETILKLIQIRGYNLNLKLISIYNSFVLLEYYITTVSLEDLREEYKGGKKLFLKRLLYRYYGLYQNIKERHKIISLLSVLCNDYNYQFYYCPPQIRKEYMMKMGKSSLYVFLQVSNNNEKVPEGKYSYLYWLSCNPINCNRLETEILGELKDALLHSKGNCTEKIVDCMSRMGKEKINKMVELIGQGDNHKFPFRVLRFHISGRK